MARFSVFISYSKKDSTYLDELLEHLAPFDLDFDPWTDQNISAGQSWNPEIIRAMKQADAAVLLVSPSLLATQYVCNVEIPFLMEAANAKKLFFAPLFVRPSNAEHMSFGQIVKPGSAELGAKITDYQGLNRPDRPIAKLGDADRDAAWVDCAQELWDSLKKHHQEKEQRSREDRAPAKTVTVELELNGQRLKRKFSVPGDDPTPGPEGSIDINLLKSLRKTRNDLELGERLFQALFGDDEDVATIIPALLGKPTPLAHFGIRLQVLTDSKELQDLPWACCAWRQNFLAEQDWSFELVNSPSRRSEVELETPCSAVMIGAELEEFEFGLTKHFQSFEGVLDRSWDHPPRIDVRWLQTVEELKENRTVKPQLIYVCARARKGSNGESEIALRDLDGRPKFLSAEATIAALLSPKSSIVVFETFGPTPLISSIPGAAAVLHLRSSLKNPEARAWANTFWSQVLDGLHDPAQAFQKLGAAARRVGAIWTDYAQFETRVSERTPKVDRARMKLDRRVQREAVMTMVRDLTLRPQRKVTCVVAYGSTGNLVEHFAVQVTTTIREWASDLVRLHRHKLSFPDPTSAIHVRDFDEILREYLELQPEQPLFEGFDAKTRRGNSTAPLHFVVWECKEEAPKGPALTQWLRYSSEYLSAGARGQLRILNYIAVTLDNERHRGFLRFLEGQSQSAALLRNHFRLEVLQPLERISVKDLRDFLRDDANTSCPPSLREAIAERIHHETDGEFEQTIDWLERAEKANLWPELLDTLPEPGTTPTPEDY